MSELLVRELRESSPYLQDEGWHEVAKLMALAADEIERLAARLAKVECSAPSRAGPSAGTGPG
jgi:hypothetical protein